VTRRRSAKRIPAASEVIRLESAITFSS